MVAVTTTQNTDRLLEDLARRRQEYALPPRLHEQVERFTKRTLELLFPHFAAEVGGGRGGDVGEELAALRTLLGDILRLPGFCAKAPELVTERFIAELPNIYAALMLDAQAICDGDPAAESVDEVILAYPGFYAIALHRIAHELVEYGVPLVPRMISEIAHRDTGVDIHPAATIGKSLAIDHGTGIVVGETAILGDGVKLYQGVTLGALSVKKEMAAKKRHPTIGDRVVIYANATILGGDTVIGAGSRIGGNVWLTKSVPANSIVTPQAKVDRTPASQAEPLLDFNI